jgi:hypothetical protein
MPFANDNTAWCKRFAKQVSAEIGAGLRRLETRLRHVDSSRLALAAHNRADYAQGGAGANVEGVSNRTRCVSRRD